MVSEGRHCKGARRDGEPCNGQALLSDGYCFAHSPQNQANAASARAAGGRGRARSARAGKLLPANLKPLLGKLLAAVDEVHDGTLPARQGEVMGSLAGAIVRLFEVAALEERLAALEAAQTAASGRRTA